MFTAVYGGDSTDSRCIPMFGVCAHNNDLQVKFTRCAEFRS